MKLFCCIILGAFMVMSASCSHNSKETRRMQTVKIDTVFSVEGQTPLQFPGKVKAAQDVNLSFRVSGTIGKICVEDGARVRKGQLLAQLDPTDYRIQLEATEAEYQQVKAEAERVMALYKDNGTTPNANDKAVYGLKQITAKYQHHKDQLEYTNLYAPFDGFVQKHLFDEHETVGAGMPVISYSLCPFLRILTNAFVLLPSTGGAGHPGYFDDQPRSTGSGNKSAGSRIYSSYTVYPLSCYI